MPDLVQLNRHILAIDDGDDASRRQALQSLRQHAEQEWAATPNQVIESLVKVLKGQLHNELKQPYPHKEVATILGNLGLRSKSAIPQLVELLQEGVPDPVREAAVIALGKMGKEAKVAVGKLVPLMETCRPTLSAQIIRALGNIGCADQGVRSALVSLWLLPDQFQGGQVQVAIALCKLKIEAQGLREILTKTLVVNQEAALRKSAAEALAWCGKNVLDVVPALLTAAVADTNEEVRHMAQAGLDQLQLSQEKAIQLCSKQLKDSNYAEIALRKSGPVAVPALMEVLSTPDSTVRIKAARTLGCFGELAVPAAHALTKILHDKDREVRLAAAKSLWNINKNVENVVPVLVDLLEEESGAGDSSETRRMFLQTVIEALGRMGPPAKAAIPALNHMTKDKNRHVSASALHALRNIDPSKAPAR